MDKTSTQSVPEHSVPARASELDKFKLFFEISTTTQEERSRIKRQGLSSRR